MNRLHPFRPFLAALFLSLAAAPLPAEPAATDPAAEPSVTAVAKALPAVVNINTERIVRRAYRDPYDDFITQFFGEQTRPRREMRQKVQSLGSGFLVDPSGYIVTNEHVVDRAEDLKIQVTTPDGKTYNARYVTGDSSADLALLKIESPTPLPYLSLKDLSPNLLGQSVLVVGNPLGYGHSVARGILSATNRTLSLDNNDYEGLLQTDAAINPGNSGGPLIDLSGKLIGVASAKMAYTPQGLPTQGIGFAIPARTVAEKVEQFKRDAQNPPKPNDTAQATRKRLGLTLQELTAELSDALGVPAGSGVLIADVEAQSPAARGGLRRGLVLYKVGRYEVNSPADVDAL
ncbi:MAG: trypsin-like peptidase domain-containing protein, partial [Chthoniobacteraceae bacterium]|nr:trypsin-like peptidase domain-containing protein [Chthoniobacteraceae bacterium]